METVFSIQLVLGSDYSSFHHAWYLRPCILV